VSGERQATVQAIERCVHGEALSVLAEGADVRRHQWVRDLRACRADWGLCQLAAIVARDLIAPEGVPPEMLLPMAKTLAAGNMQAFMALCNQHPAAMLWALRTVAQQALIRGLRDELVALLPMITKLAEALDKLEWHLDAGLLCMAAGDYARALQHFEQVARLPRMAPAVSAMIASLKVLTGSAPSSPVATIVHAGAAADEVFVKGYLLPT
jgi:hypothetical protein